MRENAVHQFANAELQLSGAQKLQEFARDGDQIVEGVIWGDGGVWYPVIDGVPSFLTGALEPDFTDFAKRHGLPSRGKAQSGAASAEQAMTTKTFSDKWRRFKRYGLEPQHQEFLFGWYLKKFGLQNHDELIAFYRDRRRVLEVGPGSGFNTKFIAEQCRGDVVALDVSDAAFTTYENTKQLANCTVVQADLMLAPFPDDHFDLIIADGVLHHTPNTRAAVEALYRKLAPGGQFYFYLYRKMGASRVFADEYIRSQFTKLAPEDCYAACEGITELGRALSNLNATVTLDKPIEVLGIPAGTHNVQRLIYYNFLKCFWNDSFDFETNNMVNFDWYHPHNAWQHSEDEVAGWIAALGVREFVFNNSNPNGISTLLRKPAS